MNITEVKREKYPGVLKIYFIAHDYIIINVPGHLYAVDEFTMGIQAKIIATLGKRSSLGGSFNQITAVVSQRRKGAKKGKAS